MKQRKKLDQLARIINTEFHIVQLELAKLRQRETELREALRSLSASLQTRSLLQETDTSLVGGADINWQAWVEQRRRLINRELALCLVEQEKARESAQKAFGREQAVKSLIKRQITHQKQIDSRKNSYT